MYQYSKMFVRGFHISCTVNNTKKLGLKLNKMLHPKVKRQWYPSQTSTLEYLPTIKNLTKTTNVPGKQGSKRLAMLNKLFMKHITDMMSTGTVAMGIVGRGIEISKVKISPDFHTVSVFWVCKGEVQDEETEAILNKTAGALRHELSTLRVMGEVPYIVFVKDKQEARVVELDRCLATADYGDDYTPTEMGHLLKSEFTLHTKLSPEVKAKIKQLEDNADFTETPMPEMTHTIFGLDHAKIMSRLLAARKKSRDAWAALDDTTHTSPVLSYRAGTTSDLKDIDVDTQKQELAEFLVKRQIEQNKLHKRRRDDEQWQLSGHEENEEYEETDEEDDLDEEYDYYTAEPQQGYKDHTDTRV